MQRSGKPAGRSPGATWPAAWFSIALAVWGMASRGQEGLGSRAPCPNAVERAVLQTYGACFFTVSHGPV